MRGPVASYRVQLTPSRGFDAVRRSLPRLQVLGISHLYLSPVTEAVPGSAHGYDVVDHTRVRDELGGLDGLTALLDDLADRGMAAMIDHVANHVSVERPELNRHWWELLRDGRGSAADRWFDVDWDAGGGTVLLPVLADALGDLDVRVDGALLHVGALTFPLAPGTERLPALDALARQHYRPIHWRDPARNVRRFFTVDQLVAVRVEHPEVAAEVDTVPRLLAEHAAFGGVRVDHIDGLADPAAYLHGLRDLIGDRWLLVEKILAPGEHLPADWPVDGTTGYEHARVLEHALLDGPGWSHLARRWSETTGDTRPYRAWELDARREVLAGALRPDRDRVAVIAATALPDEEPEALLDAVTQLSAQLRRYRTYLPDDPDGRDALEAARADAATDRPDLITTIDAVADGITVHAGAALRTRWQQLTGPAAAKGVEDRAFWRYFPLASLGEVGGYPEADRDDPVAALHAEHATVQAAWPTTMLAGTTHDSKRSEGVRAVGLALAGTADAWLRVLDEWTANASFPDLDGPAQWLALQTVATTPELSAARLEQLLVKAAREADLHTSWTDPDETYEARLGALAHDVLAWPPIAELAASLDRPGRALDLAMLAVRCTAPGVPDVYQGTEAFRALLVDPDNRVPPDERELDALVNGAAALDGPAAWAEPAAPSARAVVLRRLLALRRDRPEVFGRGGGYRALAAERDDDSVVAFGRLDADGELQVITVVARSAATDAVVELPAGRWRHVLDDESPVVSGRIELGPALARFPAVVVVRA